MHVTEKHLLKQIIKHHDMILNIILNNVKLKKLLSNKII